MKHINDPELFLAFQKREMLVERKLNILRAYVVLFLTVLDIIIAWLSGMFNIQLTLLFIGLGLTFATYFFLINYVSSGKFYYPWLKYITVTVDYLFTFAVFFEYRYTNFFRNMPGEIVVFHFITIIIFINLLSVARYSRTVILYSTFLGVSIGTYLLVRYVPITWSTWFTTLLILFSGLITFLFSSDLNTLFFKLRQRDKLNRFLSKEIIQSIDQGLIDIKLGGEKKQVTILIADIRNFSKMSEYKDAYEIVTTLNEYFSEMTNIIFKYGGMVDKFMGDSVMAVFGTPISRTDDSLRAVKAGLEMQNQLAKLNTKWESENKTPLKAGIAIHTGTVVAGNIGSTKRMEYTVIGDTVNLTSRIEGMNKTYQTDVLISETTYNSVKEHIKMKFVAETQVRGRTQPIRLYTIEKGVVLFDKKQQNEMVGVFADHVDLAHLIKLQRNYN